MRPEHIHDPQYAPPGILGQPVEGTVEVTELMGNEIFVYLRAGEHSFIARVDPRFPHRMGQKARVLFDMSQMHLFDPETEKAIPFFLPEPKLA